MAELNVHQLLLVVVGAHLQAEIADRPLAYRFVDSIGNWLHQQTQSTDWPIKPIVCTDVWYLNNKALHRRPTISVGGPGVNALSAFLYQKLPTALAIEDKLVVQVDVEMTDLRASVWGVDRQHTAAAMEMFEKKYLADFLRAASTQIEPDLGLEDEDIEEELDDEDEDIGSDIEFDNDEDGHAEDED